MLFYDQSEGMALDLERSFSAQFTALYFRIDKPQ